jgi:hypothetical protein
MLVQINTNQLRQNEIININRIAVDEKLWELNQLLNPSALQVKYDDLSNEYQQLLTQYSKLYEEWSTLSPFAEKVAAITPQEENHV